MGNALKVRNEEIWTIHWTCEQERTLLLFRRDPLSSVKRSCQHSIVNCIPRELCHLCGVQRSLTSYPAFKDHPRNESWHHAAGSNWFL
jgi:hypothetical protein